MFLQSEIGDVAAVAGKDFGFRQRRLKTGFVRIAKEEFTGLDGLPRSRSRLVTRAVDGRFRKAIAISEMLMWMRKGRNGGEIQIRQKLDATFPAERVML